MRQNLIAVLVALAVGAAVLYSSARAYAADFLYGCAVPGADAGSLANIQIAGGNQFMVSCPNNQVQYKVCVGDGGGCSATSTSAPIAANTQTDLCAPSSYAMLSLFKVYDAGNPTCCVYRVTPPTVCQYK